ncbi:MAG TPA: bifunctional phosphopantothenoylcysteine decarboxylase/phosphopantothenate--cysteine ligase CoaBC, partial [Longimicrobiales bacterium]
RAPVLLCPAMNDAMWAHPQTQRNAEHVRDVLGYRLIGPAIGPLAFGEGTGPGRMDEPNVIIEHVGRALEDASVLTGKRVVVTAGPTREAVDPVRVLSNRSSGRMGYAIAAAAWRRGADVLLISGPSSVAPPVGPRLQHVETADDMANAVRAAVGDAEVLIMAAAVADFRPAAPATGKIKKQAGVSAIELEPAPDVLNVTRTQRAKHLKVIGFALETDSHEANAKKKLQEKGMDLVVLNDATETGAGFEVATNKVTIFSADGSSESLPLMSKDDVAEAIIDRLIRIL